MAENKVFERIENEINNNDVVLFMKGNEDFPQCGFSSMVVAILQKTGVDFQSINVLEDEGMRIAIKEYSDWPTIPQLYVKGEFIGGCDIVRELYENGEFADILKNIHNFNEETTQDNANLEVSRN